MASYAGSTYPWTDYMRGSCAHCPESVPEAFVDLRQAENVTKDDMMCALYTLATSKSVSTDIKTKLLRSLPDFCRVAVRTVNTSIKEASDAAVTKLLQEERDQKSGCSAVLHKIRAHMQKKGGQKWEEFTGDEQLNWICQTSLKVSQQLAEHEPDDLEVLVDGFVVV